MNDESKLFSLRYIGDRFNNARLPVNVLPDLAVFRDLIVALAKQEFLNNNPDCKNVPKGFDKAISFALVDVDEGSAEPVLSFENNAAQLNLPKISDQMEVIIPNSLNRAVKIFDENDSDDSLQTLPKEAIAPLLKFGSNIQDGERIEFPGRQGKNGSTISIDFNGRKNLLSRMRATRIRKFEGIGKLTGLDATKKFIQIQTEIYGELRLSLKGSATSVNQFDGHLYWPVNFSISVVLDSNNKCKSIQEVHSVDLVQEEDAAVMKCLTRLQDLSKIERGWLGDDQGEQIVHLASLRAVQIIFVRSDLAELFRIFPTENGGISLEFDKDTWNFAVEILPNGSVEIDGSSIDGRIFEIQSFESLSRKFFKALDLMTSVVF